jgi:hypothetical protein
VIGGIHFDLGRALGSGRSRAQGALLARRLLIVVLGDGDQIRRSCGGEQAMGTVGRLADKPAAMERGCGPDPRRRRMSTLSTEAWVSSHATNALESLSTAAGVKASRNGAIRACPAGVRNAVKSRPSGP